MDDRCPVCAGPLGDMWFTLDRLERLSEPFEGTGTDAFDVCSKACARVALEWMDIRARLNTDPAACR